MTRDKAQAIIDRAAVSDLNDEEFNHLVVLLLSVAAHGDSGASSIIASLDSGRASDLTRRLKALGWLDSIGGGLLS